MFITLSSLRHGGSSPSLKENKGKTPVHFLVILNVIHVISRHLTTALMQAQGHKHCTPEAVLGSAAQLHRKRAAVLHDRTTWRWGSKSLSPDGWGLGPLWVSMA
eukprot:5521374-Amphidinium_carterae.1